MKSARLSIRIHPHDKEVLEFLAKADLRSVADEVTYLIRKEMSQRQKEYDKEQAVIEGLASCEQYGE